MLDRQEGIGVARLALLVLVLCGSLLTAGSPVAAMTTPAPGAGTTFDMQLLGKAVFAAFVLAVLLESALALIFNWRPFVRQFDGRGVRTVISFALSCLLVSRVDLDLLRQFSAASGAGAESGSDPLGYALTAMIVAGGSSGVNTLLVALGFRSETRAADVIAKPAPEFAWLAVRLVRLAQTGATPVRVMLAVDDADLKLIGMINGKRSPPGLLRWFLQDYARFPTIAGYSVPGDHRYALRLERDDTSAAPPTVRQANWGPFVVGKGAIIDIELSV